MLMMQSNANEMQCDWMGFAFIDQTYVQVSDVRNTKSHDDCCKYCKIYFEVEKLI